MPTLHLLVKGKVQGVFFRATAKDVAEKGGITGWVKNTGEGDVEIMACGTREQLADFIRWCKEGPRKAIVEEVIVTEIEDETFEGFKIVK